MRQGYGFGRHSFVNVFNIKVSAMPPSVFRSHFLLLVWPLIVWLGSTSLLAQSGVEPVARGEKGWKDRQRR